MLFDDRLGRLAIRSMQWLVVLALGAVVVWALAQVQVVVIALLVALLLAVAIGPVVNWMRRRGLPAIIATWLTFLGLLLSLAGIVALITLAVRTQWDELVDSAAQGLDQLSAYLAEGPIEVSDEQIGGVRDAIVGFVTSAQFGSGALAGVSAATEFITGTVLVVVILFFFLKDGPMIWEFLLRTFAGQHRARGERVGRTGLRVLGGYVRGTAIIALFDAVAIGLGLAILQVPLALPLAVVVFLTAFVPIVGATIAGAIAALVALVANGPFVALIVVIIVVVVNQLEGDLLQPLVMAQSVRLHPLVILVALTAGTILAGIAGAVLAVPLTAVAWAIVRVWDNPDADISWRRRGSGAVARPTDAGPVAPA
jgi:predicted PurR-regulated permease PerM